jgi:hypothetical protein
MSTLIENTSTPSNSGEHLREEGFDVPEEEDNGQGDPSSHSPRASRSGLSFIPLLSKELLGLYLLFIGPRSMMALPILLERHAVVRAPGRFIPLLSKKLLGLYLLLIGPRSMMALINRYPPLSLLQISFNNF